MSCPHTFAGCRRFRAPLDAGFVALSAVRHPFQRALRVTLHCTALHREASIVQEQLLLFVHSCAYVHFPLEI
jgi:hypothetical protein